MAVRPVTRAALRSVLAGAIAVAALAACATTPGTGSSSTAPGTPDTATATQTPAPRQVAVGEPIRVQLDEGGSLVLVLEAIATAADCPGRGVPVQLPSQAFFVVLDLTASFEPDGSLPADRQFAPTGAEVFRITGPDGVVQAISSTDASWACFEDPELLPPFMDSTNEVEGKVVLDSRTDHGTVTYGGSTGWYWSF